MKRKPYTDNLSSADVGPSNWRLQSRCRDIDPAQAEYLFWPSCGSHGLEGKRFCLGCPVRQQCEDEAFRLGLFNDEDGIWGARSVADRKRMRRGIDVPLATMPENDPIPEGVPTGSCSRCGCDLAKPRRVCDVCQRKIKRRSERERFKVRRDNVRALLATGGAELVRHGSDVAVRAGCTCHLCAPIREARNARDREYDHAKRKREKEAARGAA